MIDEHNSFVLPKYQVLLNILETTLRSLIGNKFHCLVTRKMLPLVE